MNSEGKEPLNVDDEQKLTSTYQPGMAHYQPNLGRLLLLV